MLSDGDLDALLGNLYYGVPGGEPERVRTFIRALARHCRCSRVDFVRGHYASPQADLVLAVENGKDLPAAVPGNDSENRWFQHGWQQMRAGGVFSHAGAHHPAPLRSRHDDVLRRRTGSATTVVICIEQNPRRGAFVELRRSPDAGEFDSDSLCQLRQLAPHLVQAYRLRSYFKHLEVLAAQPGLHHHGMFLLDEQWCWIGGNEVAEQMVADGWWRGRRNAPLDASHPVTRERWKVRQQQMGQDGAQPRVIPVRNPAGVLVALAHVHPYEVESSGTNVMRYLLFVRPLNDTHSEMVGAELRQLFGLTAGESALALSLRKQTGMAHAAAALGIAESSARTRLQSVFEKTNTHCQAELVVLIAALSDTVV